MLKTGTQLALRTLVQSFAKPLIVNVSKKPNLLSLNAQSIRNTSFFNRLTQEQLWKGVTSVSNAGRRRGRGKRGDGRGRRNLNEGQKLGNGKIKILWPGLNQSVLEKHSVREIKKIPDSENKEVAPVHSHVRLRRSRKVHPLDRGWTAKTTKGKHIGPPESIEDETFEGFQSIILQHKLQTIMSATLGRKRRFMSIVATGNGNGLIGVGKARVADSTSAIKLAKLRASRRLLTINLIDKNIINHDFFTEYGKTKITVFKKPEGYGLHCQRVILALCKLIGIESLQAVIEGPSNTKNIIRAFLVGLLRQKTYQEIADEKKLHLVEFKEETFNFPQLLASPQECLTPAEARKNSVLFEEYIMGGKLVYKGAPKIPFYQKLPGWRVHLKKTLFTRNHKKVKVQLLVKYGAYISHLTRIYPECRRVQPLKKVAAS